MSLSKKQSSENSKQIIVINESEDERLRRDIYRPDMEKFQLFMQMLRNNAVYKKAKITHK
jgi:hypothetical protein